VRLKSALFAGSLLALIGMGSLVRGESVPLLKPKVGEPVLQDLMGGCSLRYAFFWETLAGSSVSTFKPASDLCDDDAMIAWISPFRVPARSSNYVFRKNFPRITETLPSTESISPTA